MAKKGLLLMMFTCSVCSTRASRTFSKDAYESGVVLVRCEGCDNLHLIADNYGWFRDEKVNIEQIMKEQGKKVFKNFTNEAMEFTLHKPEEDKDQPEIEYKRVHVHSD